MADKTPQTHANHARTDPAYHFLLLPLSALILIYSVYLFFRNPRLPSGFWVILAVGFVLLVLRLRIYSLKVQDRVIRLEERLRLAALLPESDRRRIHELTEQQLIALRFASDEELPSLAMRAVNEKLSGQQIKGAIENWRPDYYRV
jgi:high-affinity Fe2+/Pb2+ permease